MTAKPYQIDNSAQGVAAKVSLRHWLISALKKEGPIALLETFGGEGHLYETCYRGQVAAALAFERRDIPNPKGRRLIRGDCHRLLRSIDPGAFNLFDLDAWGSPWYAFWLIVLRLTKAPPGRLLGFALTDGLTRKANSGLFDRAVGAHVGLPPKMKIPCLNRHMDFIQRRLVQRGLALANAKFIEGRGGENEGKHTTYLAFLARKS
jgi:hypothetical protein